MDLNIRSYLPRFGGVATPHEPFDAPARATTPPANGSPLGPRLIRQNAFTEHSGDKDMAGRMAVPEAVERPRPQIPIGRLHELHTSRLTSAPQAPATSPSPSRPGKSEASTSASLPQATTAGPSRPAREAKHKAPKVPAGLHKKLKAIKLSKLRKIDPGLHAYAEYVVNKASKGERLDKSNILEQDKEHLPLLAKMENHRNPGLNLSVFKTAPECFQAIHDQQKTVQRTGQAHDMRIVYPPFKGGMANHHVALDVRLRPGRNPSIIVFETAPAVIGTPHAVQIISGGLTGSIKGAHVSVVENGIQNSEHDCMMFALNASLKSFKTHDKFAAAIHDRQNVSEIPLPVEFSKHIQSKTAAEERPDANAVVTKDAPGVKAETLLQRAEAYRSEHGGTSIEGFRLQEIRRAGDYLAQMRNRRAA